VTEHEQRVVWAAEAQRDLRGIVLHVAADSSAAADRLSRRLRDQVERLMLLPERGRIVPELRDHGITRFRELIVKPYRIVYHVSAGVVAVLCVFDGRRELEDLLLERLTRIG
jgi:plasmid stabilization system protein ParE